MSVLLHHSTINPAAWAAGFLFLGVILTPAQPAAAPKAQWSEGRIVSARGTPLLVETAGGLDLVTPAPAASLTGMADLLELQGGDRVRYFWRLGAGGVKIAEKIQADPVVRSDPGLIMEVERLSGLIRTGPFPLVIDARPGDRYRAGHLPGARALDAGASEKDMKSVLPREPGTLVVVYGESPRTDEALALARRILAAGHKNIKVLDGGVQRWVGRDHPLAMEARAVGEGIRRGKVPLVIDVRPAEQAALYRIPASISIPSESFRWEDFGGRTPLPPLVLVGSDAIDPDPSAFAERIRLLRSGSQFRPAIQLYLLEGGMAAWREAGLALEQGGALATVIPYRLVVPGEIAPDEFEKLWNARGGAGTVLLDVRGAAASPEEWVIKISLEELAGRLGELPKDREIVAFCTIGERSRTAMELLRSNGYRARFLRASSGH